MSSTRDLSRQRPTAGPDASDSWDASASGLLRKPPQDLDAEQAVLGTLMSSTWGADQYVPETLETGIVAEEYYRPAHRMIHRAIIGLRQADEPVDPLTVAAELVRRGELAKVGGAPYLHSCVEAVPTPANGPSYAEIVRAKAYRRTAIESAQRILQYAYSEEGDELDVRSLVEQELTAIVVGTPGLHTAPP
ncbi:DnaB-like helicase N-terminal domain-containing protein, partial [Streptomyces sp. NPDC058394]|uniref:DnaB-like helicase N-terminal domain-containing protein n=1 Tax=Streptomyces sp. NPDC058394 TaxID=3346477 RepID=UPI003663BFDE